MSPCELEPQGSPTLARTAMPSVYDHMHSMLQAGLLKRLDVPLPDGDVNLAAVRSARGGTLLAAIDELDKAAAEYDALRLEGHPPHARFFKGDHKDVSKIAALKAVAGAIKLRGSMISCEAVQLLCSMRTMFIAQLANSGFPFKSPQWNAINASNELLARLPLLRVPLDSFGPCGGGHGGHASLLVPIMPGMCDADLLEHIELIKDLREAHAAAARRGADFDPTTFRLLIDAQPPCVCATLDLVAAIHV